MLAIVAAILLPSLIYLLVSIGLGYREERRAVELATLQRASEISRDVEAELRVTAATMRALGTIRSIRGGNWAEARVRSGEIAALQPDWREVALFDIARGIELYTTRRDGVGRSLRPASLQAIAARARDRPIFSGIVRKGREPPVLMAYLAVPAGKNSPYLLAVALSPDMIQRVLMARAPREGVSGVVDRAGMFIARSKGYPERIGTPGTHYLRDAIRAGSTGFYHGVTWEGLESYSGFTTSPATGWSSHVAVSSTLIDAPQRWWMLSSVFAALISIALALILLLLTNRMLRGERLAAERMRQAERLETVGKLTGGVAHDFNNMLAIIRGNLELALRRYDQGSTEVPRHLQNALEGVTRAADLTQRLLAFSRRQALSPVAIDVNALLRGIEELVARTLSATIRIELRLAPELHSVMVDRTSLENAIINLAVNARDAMPGGGTLTIETRDMVLGQREVRPFGVPPGLFVRIAISDTGSGMSAEVLAKAFEPFFTTKDVGRGTGLGLSQVHGFVTQSGGFVDIVSQPDQGTTVALHFPGHDRAARQADGGVADQPARARSGEVILLVEDEEMLRQTNADVLRELGYIVHEAADADEALRILEAQPVRILVTDIVMPGMTGIDLAKRAAARLPGLPVLFVTGFERDATDAALEKQTLRKPFGVDELAGRVRAALDETAARPDR